MAPIVAEAIKRASVVLVEIDDVITARIEPQRLTRCADDRHGRLDRMSKESGYPDKNAVLLALRERVATQLAAVTKSQQESQAGATHAETRAEDPKDMRSTEASYLARGLAERVAKLQFATAQLGRFEIRSFAPDAPISAGALMAIEDETGEAHLHFFVPVAGGEKLVCAGQTIHSLSPESPLGREVLGREAGDDFEFDLPRGRVPASVLWVR